MVKQITRHGGYDGRKGENMKYWLDLIENDNFILKTVEENDEVCKGKLSDIGITENDPNFTNKLDDYFEKCGIKPDEWEIG